MEPNATKFDLIILGASGFTGKYVLKEALKFLNTSSSPLTSIAIAGRSPTKLAQTLQWASKPNPPPSLPILHADTTDPSSLRSLCSQTHLILNCVGPFRHHGEPVVAACTDTGYTFYFFKSEDSFWSSFDVFILRTNWFLIYYNRSYTKMSGSIHIHSSD
ncbi:putative NAD(P)-binding domain-containing protein [Medicago truncatula]|uniref:Putative NAD(P)-binding domain-containing protein n=1 Tax=Medicago truncatula TaxID=3880 RepID=A0A396GVT5_MEDTR|nr:putative NAD(P)-binding domain-containing protein [Medicago truncatula]